MQTSYFGYFGHAWLHTPKIIKSTCTRLWCLSVCKKQTSSFILFLRYYILKNPAIWLAVPIWGLEFCQIWDWWWNINSNISFHFRLFPRKTNDKIFQKIPKSILLVPFWAKQNFLEKRALSVFRYSNYLPSCQKSEKTNEQFCGKTVNWWADRQTSNCDFIGPSVGRGSKTFMQQTYMLRKPRSFQNNQTTEIGLSDLHKLVVIFINSFSKRNPTQQHTETTNTLTIGFFMRS